MRNNILIAFLAIASISSGADAAVVVERWNVTGSNFVYVGLGDESLLPVEPATFDVTIQYDNAFDVEPTSDGLTVHSSNLPGPMQFSYRADLNVLAFGVGIQLAGCRSRTPSTWCVLISPFDDQPIFEQTLSNGAIWDAQNVKAVSTGGVIPEPAAWALMISGFGLVGTAARRRRYSTAA